MPLSFMGIFSRECRYCQQVGLICKQQGLFLGFNGNSVLEITPETRIVKITKGDGLENRRKMMQPVIDCPVLSGEVTPEQAVEQITKMIDNEDNIRPYSDSNFSPC